jgi:hypothetical protein
MVSDEPAGSGSAHPMWRSRAAPPASAQEPILYARAEVIRAKVGVLELAKQLGNFSQARKMMGQTWIRNDALAPDWLRIGSDIVGGSAKFKASFSLDNVGAVPLPAALPLFATGLGAMGLLGWRRKHKAAAIAALC